MTPPCAVKCSAGTSTVSSPLAVALADQPVAREDRELHPPETPKVKVSEKLLSRFKNIWVKRHSPQGISVCTVPGMVIEMTPAHVHMHLLVLFSAGMLAMSTVGEPGAHGAAVTGTHGTGVGTPRAADVAAIKAGFVGALHIPKGGIFTTGLESMMFAAGLFSTITRLTGRTIRDDGATPKLHCIIAPITTCFAITGNSRLDTVLYEYCVLD